MGWALLAQPRVENKAEMKGCRYLRYGAFIVLLVLFACGEQAGPPPATPQSAEPSPEAPAPPPAATPERTEPPSAAPALSESTEASPPATAPVPPPLGPPPEVTILKVWSDQFPGVVANYLPDGAGWTGNKLDYILAGARKDDMAYAKAEFRITPDTPAWRAKLLVRLARVGFLGLGSWEPVGHGTISGNVASMWVGESFVPLVEFTQDFAVVAGFDLDGDGELDVTEMTAPTPTTGYRFKFVSSFAYTTSISTLSLLDAGAWVYLASRLRSPFGLKSALLPELKHGPWFLQAFLYSTPIPGADREDALLHAADAACKDEVMCLGHNVGARFNPEGIAEVDRWDFPADSELAHDVRRSFNWIKRLDLVLQGASEEVLAKLATPYQEGSGSPEEDRFTFPFTRTLSGVELEFKLLEDVKAWESSDPDLFITFGRAKVYVTITGTVRRDTGQLASLDVSGYLEDLYDWHYDVDRPSGMVQAGYGSFNGAGEVFFSRVRLDCTYHDLDVYFGRTTAATIPRESGCSVAVPVQHAEREQARGKSRGDSTSQFRTRVLPGIGPLIEEVVQNADEGSSLPIVASGAQIAGSVVEALEWETVITIQRPSAPSVAPYVSPPTGEQYAAAQRQRPVMVVTMDPETVAKSHSAILVLSKISALVRVRTGPPDTTVSPFTHLMADDGQVMSFSGLRPAWTSDQSGLGPYEVRLYATTVPRVAGLCPASRPGDLFGEGVLVGAFKTDAIPRDGPLRVALDTDALRSVSQAAGGCVAFVVRGFEDLHSLVQQTTVTEVVSESRPEPISRGEFRASRGVQKWLGRAELLSFSTVEPSSLVLEWGKPEVAGGGTAASGTLVGMVEERAPIRVSP